MTFHLPPSQPASGLDPAPGPAPGPEVGAVRVESLYGPLSCPDWPDDLILRTLRDHGEWGAVEAELAARILPEGGRLWDVGAFLGTFSLGVSRLRTPGSVLGVEANPDLLPHLGANLRQGLSCPSALVGAGVGMRPGWLSLVPESAGSGNRGAQSYRFHERPEEADGAAVPCRTLAQLREAHGDYDLLKLDIEGAELDAIRGDYRYLKERRPILWIECNETRASLEVLSALRSLDYEPLYIAFPAFRRANFKGDPDPIYPMAYEAALVAARPERLAAVDWAIAGEEIIVRPVATHFDLRRALFDTPRWSLRDWTDLGRAELIARLTRAHAGQGLGSFLTD